MTAAARAGIGFAAEVIGPSDSKNLGETLRKVEPEDLIKYGLIPEFVGRMPSGWPHSMNWTLGRVGFKNSYRTKNSLTKQYEAIFGINDV